MTWNNATNASSAIYSEGSQLKWYGEGSGSEDLWFWAKTIWHPGPPTPWEYLWETDTDLGVVAWGGRYWFGIWWDVEGKIEVTYKHKTKNSYTNEETFTRQIFREPINISYSVFTPGDVVTSLDVSVNNPNVRITNYPGPASGGTATGTVVVENITPPVVSEWHESTTIENSCYYRSSYISEELEKLIPIPSNTVTDEYKLSPTEPYSITSIDNSNVSASIITENNKHKLKATTEAKEAWTTSDDVALADTTGKIIADFIEFNNDETEYKYFTKSSPRIISEKYPLSKQTLPSLDERRKKYTYFQDRAFLDKATDNPYVDVERWNAELFYPNGTTNAALYAGDITINPDKSTSNIYDHFPVHLKSNSSPKVFVEIKGDVTGTNGTFRYDLYYRKIGTVPVGDSPFNWQPITIETSNKMIRNGILAYWDVTGLNGEYELILRVNDSSGVVETKRNVKIGKLVKYADTSLSNLRVASPYNKSILQFDTQSLFKDELVTITPMTKLKIYIDFLKIYVNISIKIDKG